MFTTVLLKLCTGLHLVAIGTFFAWALFLEAAVLPGLLFIPPDQASKLSLIVEPRFLLVSNVALATIAAVGLAQASLLGLWSRLGDGEFLAGSRGQALVLSVLLWACFAASQAWYVFRLRPHLAQGFPFDVSRTSGDVPAEAALATRRARTVLRFQAAACMVAVVMIGGAVRYGG